MSPSSNRLLQFMCQQIPRRQIQRRAAVRGLAQNFASFDLDTVSGQPQSKAVSKAVAGRFVRARRRGSNSLVALQGK